MDWLAFSVVALWLAVIVLGVLLWALSRQVGVLFERVAPRSAVRPGPLSVVGAGVSSLAISWRSSNSRSTLPLDTVGGRC